MRVQEIVFEDDGRLRGKVAWSAVPEMTFEIEMRPSGELIGVNVRAADDHAVIASRRLRLAPIGEMQRALRAHAQERAHIFSDAPYSDEIGYFKSGKIVMRKRTAVERKEMEGQVALLRGVLKALDSNPRPGAAGRGHRHYAVIAARYVDLLSHGEAKPVEALAEQLGCGKKSASNYLTLARNKGLLTRLGRGIAGGELTDKARALLAQKED